ncbi:hypothetical protein LPJ56_004268 [Coemansia sp. RSA 2599]|nr:hypothetical protein LPJ56_004268 [Coemansia sp. RSA 2599]
MSTTIFVPPRVDVSSIQSCLQDVHATFVDMDTETFDAKAKLEELRCFIVLEKDHFVAYQKQHPGGVKCDYGSRNYVMVRMAYQDIKYKYAPAPRLKEQDGIWACEKPPVLYFAFRPNADALRARNATEDNTIAEFYDKVEDKDFKRFAEIAKTKDSCVSHFFVVCHENDYFAVDTDNPSVSYKFSASIKYRVIKDLARKAATIQDFIEEDRQLYKRKAPTKRDADFQLRDNKGVAMSEGESFYLEIYNHERDEMLLDEDNNEEFEDGMEPDYVFVFEDKHLNSQPMLCGSVGHGSIFSFKVADGITYLTNDGGFVTVDSDTSYPQIVVDADTPPKERRIQIHYAEDGNIMLSQWNGDVYVYCEWIKASYGSIELGNREYQIRWGKPMKLVIKRI